jgi:threonylcarbamoyladenosine tRNA methylthiotransferase MtaB
MRASLHTIGCRLNQAETALLADRLKKDGYQLVEFGQPTDLLIVNTCSVTDDAEKTCRYDVRRTLRHSPHAFIAVTGCYAQTGAEELRQIPGIDLIVGAQYKMNLPDYLPSLESLCKRPTPEVLHTRSIEREDFVLNGVGECASTRANLKIQDGCNVMCSFCLIPFARGHERSRRFDDALREAEQLVEKGHREIVLTGVNIGQYNQGDVGLVELIRRLEQISGLERIRISSIEPTTVSDELVEYMTTSRKLCRYLHIPLQSGDDTILEAMNRRYTVRAYAELIERIVRRLTDVGLGTDLMVGFPGEGHREFQQTVTVATDLPLSYFHVFTYSKRPGTAASRLGPPVHAATAKARSKTLSGLSRSKRLAFYHRYTGRKVRVLFETSDGALRTGWTDNYVRVGVPARELPQGVRDVVVTGVMDGLAIGHLAEVNV